MSLQAALFGTDLFGTPVEKPKAGPLAERFGVPPFSVLNAREGEWQRRKRAWIGLGIESEVGRVGIKRSDGFADCSAAMRGQVSYFATGGETVSKDSETGTSIFDPVLCELAYTWFCPPAGRVLDPFAGGSVRGIVAALLGHRYTGVDLRPEQTAANETQASAIVPDNRPTWITGDSRQIATLAPGAYDLVFSCPPYGDLERYSDDPRDLSTMDWPAFRKAYREIIAASVRMLKPDRFAVFVVGEFRRANGAYRGFVAETCEAFELAGAAYYNEAILVTQVGSLPIRVGAQFTASRKLGKTHQNLLVFVKGEGDRAAKAIGGAL